MLTISSHYVHAMIRKAESFGVDMTETLFDLGISPEVLQAPEGLVHAEQFARIAQRTWQLFDDEFWGLTSCRCKPGHFALMVGY